MRMRLPPMTHATPDLPETPPPPAAAAVVAAFAALARLRRETTAALPEPQPGIAHDPDRFAAGVPLLDGVATEELAAGLLAAAAMLPGIADIFPALAQEAHALAEALAQRPDMGRRLCDVALDGGEDGLAALAEDAGLPPAVLAFLGRELLAVAVRRQAAALSTLADDALWQKPSCPVCGSAPDAGLLKEKQEQSEFLVAKAGRLLLHCSLCGHLWRFPRLRCLACGEGDQEKLDLLIPAGRERERIHTCATCGHYLIVLNRVESLSDKDLDLDAAPAGLSHLDAAAQAKGYRPLCDAPWNRLEE